MKLVRVNDQDDQTDVIEEAAMLLLNGGVMALPTDTIYGICCLLPFSDSIERIYSIKQRDYSKPFSICISDFSQLRLYTKNKIPIAEIAKFLPGKFTLVFERSPLLNPSLNPDYSSIGVRLTQCKITQLIAERCGQPLVLTSANLSGGPNPNSPMDFMELWPSLDMVIDIGPINSEQPGVIHLGSTIIDLSKDDQYKIIRQGCDIDKFNNLLASDEYFKRLKHISD